MRDKDRQAPNGSQASKTGIESITGDETWQFAGTAGSKATISYKNGDEGNRDGRQGSTGDVSELQATPSHSQDSRSMYKKEAKKRSGWETSKKRVGRGRDVQWCCRSPQGIASPCLPS